MKKLLVINGVNLNMLGVRETSIYGNKTYQDLKKYIKQYAKSKSIHVDFFISNYEGKIVEKIQSMRNKYDGLIINPGAYSHYSIAILDALRILNVPIMEVHLSDISKREEFRKVSITALAAKKVIKGYGFDGYLMAIDELLK